MNVTTASASHLPIVIYGIVYISTVSSISEFSAVLLRGTILRRVGKCTTPLLCEFRDIGFAVLPVPISPSRPHELVVGLLSNFQERPTLSLESIVGVLPPVSYGRPDSEE
jgi:hypothetical protein